MKKILFLTILVSSVLFAGCEDFLTEAPRLTQSTELTLSSFKGLDNSIAGAYSPLADGQWYGAYYVLDAEMRSGNGKKPTADGFDSGRMTVSYNLSYSESSTSGLWGYAYYVISAANNVIDNLEGKESPDVTQQDLDNLKAEALFLRALAHFDLVRLYARSYAYNPDGLGVPIILHTDVTATEQPERNTVRAVYEQVITDLRDAEALMSDDYIRTGVSDSKAVANKNVVRALLARAYLYSQQWQLAADYATLVINSGDYTMWEAENLADAYAVDKPTSGEVIFEIYGARANSYDEYWEGPAHMTSPDGYADCGASNDLVDLYEEGDARLDLFRTHEDAQGQWWTAKYIGKGLGTPEVSNVIVLRLSEMYLIRAEAIINGASIPGTSAVADLNVITSKRNAEPYTSAGSDAVYLERRKELAFEGHLWFDASRTGRGITRVDYSGDAVNQNIPADSHLFALPIAKRELDVNENLVQNEGY
jgi:hypothetical protein